MVPPTSSLGGGAPRSPGSAAYATISLNRADDVVVGTPSSNSSMTPYTYSDSDVISFHIYASWFSPPSGGYNSTLRNVCYSAVT